MDYQKAIKNIKYDTNLPLVELVTSGGGLIPSSMAPRTSTQLGSDTYELVELKHDNNNKSMTILRKTAKDFPIPSKVYGTIYKWVHLVISSYVKLGKSSLLSHGKKGNGKTLLIDIIAKTANDKFKLPILVVGRITDGQSMVSILRQIGPCIMYMDEFTKLVSYQAQEDLLSYLSSSDSKGTIVLMTTNDINNLSMYIKQRPDRIRYHVYRGNVDEATIRTYCKEHLKYKQFIPDIENSANNSDAFNMDSLMAVVTELNMRYNPKDKVPLTYTEIISCLNVALKTGPGFTIDRVVFRDKGIKYANVELIPKNYGSFEYKMILTIKTGVVSVGGVFSRMEHRGFEGGAHRYDVNILVRGEGLNLEASIFVKELAVNLDSGTVAL